MNTGLLANEAFDQALVLVREEFSKLPDGDDITDKVCKKLKNTFDKPPTSDFEAIIHKTFTDDEVRVVLFNPSDDQTWFYVALLQVGISVPSDHSFRKLMSLILSLIFLIHRKKWKFVQEFVIAGGLEPLVEMLLESNLYERSQALETILTITDCDIFDWFIPPPDHTKHSSYTVQQMHNQLLNLGRNPHFLDYIIQNRVETYPGGSFRALQLLAFWLSWVRALYTQDQKLSLSRKLLEEIRLWSLPSAHPEEDMEEEKKLAQTLFDDFSATASDIATQQLQGVSYPEEASSSSSSTAGGSALDQWKAIGIENVLKREESNVVSLQSVIAQKEEGNKQYKKSEFEKALNSYKSALNLLNQLRDTGSAMEAEGDESHLGETEISIRSNVANTYWKLFSADESETKDIRKATEDINSVAIQYLSECESQCRAILEKRPFHVKSTYRLVSILLVRGCAKPGYDICVSIIKHLESTYVKGQKRDDLDMFDRLKLKCISNAILADELGDPLQWGLSLPQLRIFESLLKRNQLQDKVSVSKYIQMQEQESSSKVKSSVGTTATTAALESKAQEIDLNEIDLEFNGKQVRRAQDVEETIVLEKKVSNKEKSTDVKISKSKVKLSSDDKQNIQKLKSFGNKFTKGSTETLLEEAKTIIDSLLNKGTKINDIYPILMEETDLAMWLAIIKKYNEEATTLKIGEVLLGYERLQSTLLMIKFEFPDLLRDAAESLDSLLTRHGSTIKKSSKKLVEELIKLLSQ